MVRRGFKHTMCCDQGVVWRTRPVQGEDLRRCDISFASDKDRGLQP